MAFDIVLTHRKTRRLAQLLGIDPCDAVGILESLWIITRTNKNVRDGGIGRLTNIDIAQEMWTTRDPEALIEALIQSGWVDEIDSCRLYVHDWHEWSNDTVDAFLARNTQLYANGARPRMGRLGKKEREELTALFDRHHGPENLVPTSARLCAFVGTNGKSGDETGAPGSNVGICGHKSALVGICGPTSPLLSPTTPLPQPPQEETKQKLGGKTKPPAPATEGGNESPPLGEPEASPGTPMVMLVHGIERKRGSGIPDPATATDEELLAYAAKRRAQVKLDDGGGDAA